MADIVARAQGMLDHWASTYQVDRGVLLEHEVATVAELVAEVERLRSDLMLSLMGSELEKLGAERDELGQRLSELEVAVERDQLKAAVERVRALANEALDGHACERCNGAEDLADDVLDTLAGGGGRGEDV